MILSQLFDSLGAVRSPHAVGEVRDAAWCMSRFSANVGTGWMLLPASFNRVVVLFVAQLGVSPCGAVRRHGA